MSALHACGHVGHVVDWHLSATLSVCSSNLAVYKFIQIHVLRCSLDVRPLHALATLGCADGADDADGCIAATPCMLVCAFGARA
jgi:hypothetical protein